MKGELSEEPWDGSNPQAYPLVFPQRCESCHFRNKQEQEFWRLLNQLHKGTHQFHTSIPNVQSYCFYWYKKLRSNVRIMPHYILSKIKEMVPLIFTRVEATANCFNLINKRELNISHWQGIVLHTLTYISTFYGTQTRKKVKIKSIKHDKCCNKMSLACLGQWRPLSQEHSH